MFKTYPITYDAYMPISENQISGRTVAIMHAPSLMTFEMVKDAKKITGKFGYLPGAYSAGGRTNGAQFEVYWSNGGKPVNLYTKYLDPFAIADDQGLHEFEAPLTGLVGGRIYLQVKPGPNNDFSWDWTGWTDIEIK
jgi:hypothetical protein